MLPLTGQAVDFVNSELLLLPRLRQLHRDDSVHLIFYAMAAKIAKEFFKLRGLECSRWLRL